MSYPNPFEDRELFGTVIIGGRPIKATLVAIDGVEIEDEWKEQKPTGNTGATNVFMGTKAPAPVDLTFEMVDVPDWNDLREVWDQLAPVPGSGGNGSGGSVGSPGSAAAGKQYVQAKSPASSQVSTKPEDLLKTAQQALAAVNSGANTAAATGAPTASGAAAAKPTPALNPGPKPPTLSIVNGWVNYIGITAISRKKWKGPYITATNSARVTITVIPQKAPTPAAVGASSPKTPDGPKTIAFGDIQDPASAAKDANTKAAQAGAFT